MLTFYCPLFVSLPPPYNVFLFFCFALFRFADLRVRQQWSGADLLIERPLLRLPCGDHENERLQKSGRVSERRRYVYEEGV